MTNDLLLLMEIGGQPPLAVISSLVWREIAAGGAVVITLLGVRLCWRAPRYRMSVEEHAKDGKLTEEQARRKIRFMDWFGPAVTIVGCALLALAILY
jgi:hypothetical protein